MDNLSAEHNADLERLLAEKSQEFELLEAQYKESELNKEKLRRSVDEKTSQIRLLQEEVDSLRVRKIIGLHAYGFSLFLLGKDSIQGSRTK